MGGGASKGRVVSNRSNNRRASESTQSYRIRTRLQAEHKNIYREDTHLIPLSSTIENARLVLLRDFHVNVPLTALKPLCDSKGSISRDSLLGLLEDVTYDGSLGSLFTSVTEENDTLSQEMWQSFFVQYQGYEEHEVEVEQKRFLALAGRKEAPNTLSEFSSLMLHPANSAFHPALAEIERYDRPISEYYICAAKLPHLNESSTAESALGILSANITNGARVVEIHLSGGASDKEPRTMSNCFPSETPADKLPSLRAVLTQIRDTIDKRYISAPSGLKAKCRETLRTVSCMPLLLIVTIAPSVSLEEEESAAEIFRAVFMTRIDVPPSEGTIWTPLELDGKVLLILSPRGTNNKQPQPSVPSEEPDASKPEAGVANQSPLERIAHMRMLSVSEIRPILDQARTLAELRQLLRNVVLTLTATELCAHIVELGSITDMLLMHVQTAKRKVLRVKQGNLVEKIDGVNAEYGANRDQDTRHLVQFAELKLTEPTFEARFAKEVVIEELQEEVEPLRGWRYGAQIIPVTQSGHTEASLHNISLFKQQSNHGFVTRVPRSLFAHMANFVDVYSKFSPEFSHSLFVQVLSVCRLPRLREQHEVFQPCVKVQCNNGTGLRQVAITTQVDDNGCVCTWGEDFEFKFQLSDLNSSACLLLVVCDRKETTMEELCFATVPLWGLRTGFRSLPLLNLDGTPIPHGTLFTHFDWEEQADEEEEDNAAQD